jgi:hypothetical protein
MNNNNVVTDGTIGFVPFIQTNLINDPYLLSWDEYPDFIQPTPEPTDPIPTTPVPTTHTPIPTTPMPTTHTPIPTTPMPTTHTPIPTTHTPIPTTPIIEPTVDPTQDMTPSPTISNINNANTTPGKDLLNIILYSLGGFFLLLIMCCYVRKNIFNKENRGNVNNEQPYIDLESSKNINKDDKNEKNDKSDKENKHIKMRNLSPARLKK